MYDRGALCALPSVKKQKHDFHFFRSLCNKAIGHFTVVCLLGWPMTTNEAGGDLALTQTLFCFSHSNVTQGKQRELYQSKITTEQTTIKWTVIRFGFFDARSQYLHITFRREIHRF